MNRLLSHDIETFRARFRDAESFLIAGHLRYEAYSLVRYPSRSPSEEARLTELLATPACQEAWFTRMLRKDGYNL